MDRISEQIKNEEEVLFRNHGPDEYGPDPDDDGSGPDHEGSGDEDGDGGASVQNQHQHGKVSSRSGLPTLLYKNSENMKNS